MFSLLDAVAQKCRDAVQIAYPELITEAIEVTSSTQAKFGDYQCNSVMRFAKILQQSPKEVGQKLLTVLQQLNANSLDPMFAEISMAGPGFINFTIANHFLEKNLYLLLKSNKFSWEEDLEKINNKKSKVVVDFSSPNIAKDMHVGHLRSTIIGDCLARVLEFMDYDVLRINHIGDWGTQFGMLIAYLKKNNKLTEELSASKLVDYYKKSKLLFDNDINFKVTAQQEVVALQSGEKDSLLVWQKICDSSKQAYQEIYSLLDIKIIDRGESFYNFMLKEIVTDFAEKKLLKESEGAKCIYLPGFINRDNQPLPLIIQKSDGGYNYATTDLAAIKYRVQHDHANWLIYVTDSGQALHFKMVFLAAKEIGYLNNNDNQIQVNHVPFGLVLRKDLKKFKTREGETEKLKDLIDRAINKAKELLIERGTILTEPELTNSAKILGVNAIKYADLSNNRNSDYVFDYDKMLQFTGNTAAFLLYAYVRVNSIKHKLSTTLNLNELLANSKIEITNSNERALAIRICKFQDAIKHTLLELLPNRLTDYLYLLAEEFHAFFHNCRVEGSPLQNSRLLICEAVARNLAIGFNLLGLQLLNKM